MQYRAYGSTGKNISVISIGGMRFGKPDEVEEMAKIPVAAAKLGVNYFDSAMGYLGGKSEEILGVAAKEMKRQGLEYFISTKSWGDTRDQVMEHFEGSLKRLDTDHVDFFNAWCIMSWDAFVKKEKGGAFKALQELRDQGAISHAVCSTHMNGEDIARMLREGLFEGVTLGFNAINSRFRMEGIEAAQEQGLGVICMNPLAGGAIPSHEDRFQFIKSTPDQSIVDAALQFNFSHEAITSSLVGVRNMEDAQGALANADAMKPLSPEQLDAVKRNIEEGFDQLCTTCDYCKGCPQDIKVSGFMEAYNEFVYYQKPQNVLNRMKWHWGIEATALDDCTQCLECEEKCTQKLPIMERFEEIKKMAAEAAKQA